MIFLLTISLLFLVLFKHTLAPLIGTCIEMGVNYSGNDIKMYPMTSTIEDCHAYCVLTTGCQYFTFEHGNGKCWLKSAKATVQKDPAYNSGRRDCCRETGWAYHLNDISMKTVATVDECESLCQNTAGCKYWSKYTGTGTPPNNCWAKTSDSGRYANPDYVSGVPNCPKKISLPDGGGNVGIAAGVIGLGIGVVNNTVISTFLAPNATGGTSVSAAQLLKLLAGGQ